MSCSTKSPGDDAIGTARDFHSTFGYVVIGANGFAGLVALLAWATPSLRGRWVWVVTIAAEAALLLEVVLGVVVEASDRYAAERFHLFYGFVAFLTVGLAYQYRDSFRGGGDAPAWRTMEMFYGLVGLFLMGLGIRAVIEGMA